MFKFFKANEELFFNELLSDNIDVNKVQKYLDKNIDLNKKDEKGKTILFTLVAKRKLEAIKLIVKSGAIIDIEDKFSKTVLDEACQRSDGLMVRFLLDNGFDINRKNSMGRTICHDVAFDGNFKHFDEI